MVEIRIFTALALFLKPVHFKKFVKLNYLLLHIRNIFVMTGLRQVDSLAARCLLSRGRNKRAMVSRQKQEYQRQSRDVNNTRQGSRSQAQVQSSKVGQSGVKHRDGRKNNAQNVSQGKTRLRTG